MPPAQWLASLLLYFPPLVIFGARVAASPVRGPYREAKPCPGRRACPALLHAPSSPVTMAQMQIPAATACGRHSRRAEAA